MYKNRGPPAFHCTSLGLRLSFFSAMPVFFDRQIPVDIIDSEDLGLTQVGRLWCYLKFQSRLALGFRSTPSGPFIPILPPPGGGECMIRYNHPVLHCTAARYVTRHVPQQKASQCRENPCRYRDPPPICTQQPHGRGSVHPFIFKINCHPRAEPPSELKLVIATDHIL